MTITTITPLPDPPDRKDPINFDDRADDFLGKLPNFATELNALAIELNNATIDAITASSQATSYANFAEASANFKGSWSSLSGAISRPASVYHNSKFWMLLPNSLANVATSQPGVSADWVEIKNYIQYFTYANRNNVRSLNPAPNDQLIIENLGLFVWYSGSTEIDDDETCFATSSGRWLLEAMSLDMLFAYMHTIESSIQQDCISRLVSKTKKIRTTLGITSVAANTQVSTTISVKGARVGDAVIINPPNALVYNLAIYATVLSNNTVTIYFNNSTASVATIIDGIWTITILKG